MIEAGSPASETPADEAPASDAAELEPLDAGCLLVEAPRRFGGVARLFGDEAFARIAAAHACVIGLGGVGSWAAEALARSGVGRLTLIDLDHVAESNLNRQVLALDSTVGAAKVEAMRARVHDIAPGCRVDVVDDFVTADNVEELVPGDALVIDAIDQVRAKAALVATCRSRGQWLVVCGAAGGRSDPLSLRREDLARCTGDALLASLRARLRREHGYSRGVGQRFGVEAIYSDEPPAGTAGGASSLSCAGYGSVVTVTASMGLAAAARTIDAIVSRRPRAARQDRRSVAPSPR